MEPFSAKELEQARLIASDNVQRGRIIEIVSDSQVQIAAAASTDGGGGEDLGKDGNKDGGKKLPTFQAVAYTGVAMRIYGWPYPVVIDVAGLRASKRPRPVLRDHDPGAVVGHAEIQRADNQVRAAGVFSGTGQAAREVLADGLNDFPWRISTGTMPEKIIFIEAGKTAKANGREFAGPAYIVRKGTLAEISFVSLGADDDTSASIAASAIGVTDMDFQAWVKAQGFAIEDLDEKQTAALKAAYERRDGKTVPVAGGKADGDGGDEQEPAEKNPAADIQAAATKAAGEAIEAERKRVGRIEAACKGFEADPKIAELRAQALREELSEKDLLAKLVDHLRDVRPKGPAIHAGTDEPAGPLVIEAAMCQALRLDVDREYKPEVLESAHRLYGGQITLQEVMLLHASANGYRGRSAITPGNIRPVLEAAFAPIQAGQGWSLVSLSTTLSNTANKVLLESFNAVESVWRRIAAMAQVKDFKQVTRCRLTGDLEYEEVGPGGEIKHGTLGEATYTNQAKTYGKMLAITRQDIINDDLGSLRRIPQRLGRGGGLKVNTVFWTALLANTGSFFSGGHKNYASGGATALSSASLAAAELLFRDQTDEDGKPMGVMPAILLVPTAKAVTARELMISSTVQGYGGTTERAKQPTSNIWAGKFRDESSAYLSNSAISGHSATAWYLWADPADVPVIEVVYLGSGVEPVIESAEVDLNVLGVQYRGYHDFGVALQEYRGGVMMAGA